MVPLIGALPVDPLTPEIRLTTDGILYTDHLVREGLTSDIVSSYNDFVDWSKDYFHERHIPVRDNKNKFHDLVVRGPIFQPPTHRPQTCRDKGYTYSTAFTLEGFYAENPTKTKRLILGNLPLMLYSQICPLSDPHIDLTAEMECPEDAKGYLIVNGLERVFVPQEELRRNKILIYKIDSKQQTILTATITSESYNFKSGQSNLFVDKEGIIRGNLQEYGAGVFNETLLNIFILFYLLGGYRFDQGIEIRDEILKFTRPEWRSRVNIELNASLNDFINMQKVSQKKKKGQTTAARTPEENFYLNLRNRISIVTKMEESGSLATKDSFLYDRETIEQNLYPHIDENFAENASERRQKKLDLMALITVRLLEVRLGYRQPTNRNSWSNKRVKLIGPEMCRAMAFYWNSKSQELKYGNGNIDNLSSQLNPASLTTLFESYFTGSWGAASKKKKNNYVELFKGEYFLSRKYHLNKTTAGTDARARNFGIREVDQAGIGYTDPAETPEGEKVGINKTKTTGCWYSGHHHPYFIFEVLKTPELAPLLTLNTTNKTKLHPSLLVLNGVIIGVCDGMVLSQALKQRRRIREIQKDTLIIFIPADEIVNINTDSGRPTRPLLVVEKNEILAQRLGILDRIEKEEEYFDDLISEGCLDMVDAWEQEYSLVAQSIPHFNDKDRLVEDYKREIALLEQSANGLVRSYLNQRQLITPAGYEEEILEVLAENQRKIAANEEELAAISEKLRALIADRPLDFDIKFRSMKHRIDRLQSENTTLTNFSPPESQAMTQETASAQIELYKKIIEEIGHGEGYQYCQLDPNSIWSISTSAIFGPQHDQGPRISYQCKMAKQAIGKYHTNAEYRWDADARIALYNNRPLVETQIHRVIGLDKHPSAQTFILAMALDNSYTIEDALTLNMASVDRGLSMNKYYEHITHTIKPSPKSQKENPKKDGGAVGLAIDVELRDLEIGKRPNFEELPEDKRGELIEKWNKLEESGYYENGVVKPGVIVEQGTILVIQYIQKRYPDGRIEYEERHRKARQGEIGQVSKVLPDQSTDVTGERTIKISLEQIRIPQRGDKFASTHAQKGTVGRFVALEDMPFSETTGMVPDAIMNPHAIPSRMTISQLIESKVAKAMACVGLRRNMTPFLTELDMAKMSAILERNGYHPTGKDVMRDGKTGRRFDVMLFEGPVYYQQLRHQTEDKVQFRNIAEYQLITRQPITGKKNKGGLRGGEMERDAYFCHGDIHTILETHMRSSDRTIVYACERCRQEVFRSPKPGFENFCENCDQHSIIIPAEKPFINTVIKYIVAIDMIKHTDYFEIYNKDV